MNAKEYFDAKSPGGPEKGARGRVTEWLDFGEFVLRGTKCLVVDASFVPSTEDGLLVELPPGHYRLQLKGIDYGGDKRVCRLRAVLPDSTPVLGEKLRETWTDTAVPAVAGRAKRSRDSPICYRV